MGRKRKKKQTQQNNSSKQGFKRFQEVLYSALKKLKQEDCFKYLSGSELRTIHKCMIQIPRLEVKAGHHIPLFELKIIHANIQQHARSKKIGISDSLITLLEFNVLHAFYYVIEQYIESESRKQFLKEKLRLRFDLEKAFGMICDLYQGVFLDSTCYFGDAKKGYYAVDYRAGAILPQSYHFQKIPVVSFFPAQSRVLVIHGRHRPVFRLGLPRLRGQMEWLSVPTSLLADHYQAIKKYLIYIFSLMHLTD